MKNENQIPDSGSVPSSSLKMIAGDPNSSQLLNFRFALCASAVFMIGLGLFAWGIWLTYAPLAVLGFIVMFIGGWLCGSALSNE